MLRLTTNQIRTAFIDYFKKNDHKFIDSSSLIPENDSSLLFTNAGMVRFKNFFTGENIAPMKKAVSVQKCIRAGGKHNDLDNVGYTSRHHTFFEMLGNFSFNDYFKEEAIFYAFDLLTKIFEIPKSKLFITVYESDVESANLWKKISGFSDDKIIKIATNDNFWSMADTGPCGPCSEIFYDHGENFKGGLPGGKDEGGDRFIEIWNLVFMEYQRIKDATLVPLAHKSIDTGMGLERISAILSADHDNYDIDIFKTLIKETSNIIKVAIDESTTPAYKIIADHLRSASFLIADGLVPSNEGRGYVLRRIIRRGMRYANSLGFKKPIFHLLLPFLCDLYQESYPQISNFKEHIASILISEEEKFINTLSNGLKLLEAECLKINNSVLSGKFAFKLYDTYGFPLDLTKNILNSKNITVNEAEFNESMLNQKLQSKKHWKGLNNKRRI